MSAARKTSKGTTATKKRYEGFTEGERAAMRDRVEEQKVANRGDEELETAVLEKIDEMQESDRVLAKRIHAIVKATAPELSPRLWYGMPAYAKKGKMVCFFQSGQKFRTRYATFGFSDAAKLDDGNLWPNAYALTKLTAADEARIAALIKKAVS